MATFNQLTLQVLSENHQYDIDSLPATLSKEKKLTIIASRLNHIELLQQRPILGGIASIGPNTYDHRGFFLSKTNNADKRKR
jgi:vesicle coat complex subunit